MARPKSTVSSIPEVIHYQHAGEKRAHIPTAATAAQGVVPKANRKRYSYNPHLDPVLRFDTTGQADRIQALIAKAGREPLDPEEQKLLEEALRQHQPWLEWTGKREAEEKGYFEVEPVALNIHERISTQAILRAARREDVQRDLFADPQEPWQDAVKFYQHDMDWTNRLILGDSLQVMSSLAHRENLAGKVQMIYMDPPYGIKFGSNFQPLVGKRDVKHNRDEDMTREPEMVRAYRDTWELGVHSYLAYLRDRLLLARELLAESGSIFLQISDENLHHVRELMDEVFGIDCFVVTIVVKKKGSQKSSLMDPVNDYLLWYSRTAREEVTSKFRAIFQRREIDSDTLSEFRMVELPDGRAISIAEMPTPRGEVFDYRLSPKRLLQDYEEAQLFRAWPVTNGGTRTNQMDPVDLDGASYNPPQGRCWSHRSRCIEGETISPMARLREAGRLVASGKALDAKRYLSDFPYRTVSNWWDGLGGAADPVYVVQTNEEIIQRCLLMTTDPGDLVLDPTCGSGTTAYVAERWGRRWITIDTSRVALSITRQRVLTARFEIYKTCQISGGMAENPASGFIYRTVPHVMLGRIAQDTNLDPIFAKHDPILDDRLSACNAALAKVPADLKRKLETKLLIKQKEEGRKACTDADERRWRLKDKWEHWEVPFDTDPDWPAALQKAVTEYRAVWRAKMDEVNACIAANAEQEELVDQPETVPGVRVSGPFTVEGVIPPELSGDGDECEPGDGPMEEPEDGGEESRNAEAYFEHMLYLLKLDGVTFKGNQVRRFSRIEPLWNNGQDLPWHAEAWWEDDDTDQPATVGVLFGPPVGPLTAMALEEVLPRAGRTYQELVVAAFNFDPEAVEIIGDQASHPRLLIHQAFIRPDINPGMEGLLKDQPRSQLFTVFGQPEVSLDRSEDGSWKVTLKGVDIYDPLTGDVRSTAPEKVAAWFLDTDYDGRCFCVTQAFFPDQDAWQKIAKALKSQAELYAFDALKGTVSVPFKPGAHRKVAVKVIDPRGNEVMVVKRVGD